MVYYSLSSVQKHEIPIRDKNSVQYVLRFNNVYTNTTSKCFCCLSEETKPMWLAISVVGVFIKTNFVPKHVKKLLCNFSSF